jgi:hypothetical protein
LFERSRREVRFGGAFDAALAFAPALAFELAVFLPWLAFSRFNGRSPSISWLVTLSTQYSIRFSVDLSKPWVYMSISCAPCLFFFFSPQGVHYSRGTFSWLNFATGDIKKCTQQTQTTNGTKINIALDLQGDQKGRTNMVVFQAGTGTRGTSRAVS